MYAMHSIYASTDNLKDEVEAMSEAYLMLLSCPALHKGKDGPNTVHGLANTPPSMGPSMLPCIGALCQAMHGFTSHIQTLSSWLGRPGQ